jgi:hypothetical protein
MASLLSGAALLVGLIVATPGAAHATVTPPSDGWAELFLPEEPQVGYSLCLDVPGGSSAPGTRLQAFHCHGYDNHGNPQRWLFINVGNGAYQIQNNGNHLCATAMLQASSNPRYGFVTQQACGAYAGQGWNIIPKPDNPDVTFLLCSYDFYNACLATGPNVTGSVIWQGYQPTFPNEIWELG